MDRASLDSEFPPDDDSEEPPLPGLGLPSDPRYIPTFSDLRRAAERRLDWETAFILLSQDDPAEIAGRLDEMAEMVRAVISVQGPLGNPERLPVLKKAVRLGLALELRFWQRAGKFEAWLDLIAPLLTTAIQMEEFQADVFLTWSIYHHMAGNHAKAQKAVEVSQQFAAESGREDLALLAQAHQFNFDAPTMNVNKAEQRAKDLLERAQRLGYDYIRGRVYFSLARAYAEQWQGSRQVFEYAQQAAVILLYGNWFELASEALMYMFVIGNTDDHSRAYRHTLRAYFGRIITKCVSPHLQAAAYYFQGRDHYHAGQYDEAILPLLRAWRQYRHSYTPSNIARTLHMLGLVQIKRRKRSAAEFYLREALNRYRRIADKGYEIMALHAQAFIPYEYEEWAQALARLEAARAMVLAHPGIVAQETLDTIEKDMDDVKHRLQGDHPV